ncbi:GGDEF domain-containing protein [Planctobacterium marinum]|uniref:diguanylate cyclase n=1 Tax=Planctobacterium marinum TaxID=1631968 RepID=A0AA48HJM2_9ALTE|nr:GGDEF domain-containing protein [Planctobacterium marinum]
MEGARSGTGNLVENQQKQIRLLKHQVANLSEFIIRLTKVYDGGFPEIDTKLHTLRNQLKSSSHWLQAEASISELTGPILKHADALRSFNHEAVSGLETLANQVLNSGTADVEFKQLLNDYIIELNSSSMSLGAVSHHFRKGAELLFALIEAHPLNNSEAADNAGITQELHEQITREFKELIAQLIASSPQEQALKDIAEQLEGGLSRQELMQCCLVVLRTLTDELLQERKQAERYVHKLQKSLTGVGQKVEASIKSSEQQYQIKLDNSKALRSQIDDFGIEVHNAIDLAILKQQANEMLDKMATTLTSREMQDKEEQVSVMELLSSMKAQLATLERETEAYKQRLLEQKYHSYRDSLTQVPNRNAYNERVELEYRRWKRHKHPICLAVVDIDHFKKINDNFGHAAGDKTLQVIAQNISKCLRNTDFFARWGGEEFVVLLPQTPIAQVKKPLETIRKQIQKIPFKFKDRNVSITASIGATEFTQGDTIATAFERADKALYEAKNSGRNRCIIIQG